MVISGAEITALVGSYLWPLFRVGAMVMAAPIFGARTVPVRIRLGMALALTAVVVPLLPPTPAVEVIGLQAIFIVIQQILIGVVMGFAVQMVFSAVITGGQIVAMQMGLGFSLMVDPQNGTQAPVLSQFYVIMVILVYLAMNGHHVLIQIMVDSFHTLPIDAQGITANHLWQLVTWGSQIFAGAVGMALPAIASLLVVNLSFGIMTRAAPQLNIFAIGFPITMMFGFVVIFFTLPSVAPHAGELFNNVYGLLRGIMQGGP